MSTCGVAACSASARMALSALNELRSLLFCYLTEAFPNLFCIMYDKLLKSFVATPVQIPLLMPYCRSFKMSRSETQLVPIKYYSSAGKTFTDSSGAMHPFIAIFNKNQFPFEFLRIAQVIGQNDRKKRK